MRSYLLSYFVLLSVCISGITAEYSVEDIGRIQREYMNKGVLEFTGTLQLFYSETGALYQHYLQQAEINALYGATVRNVNDWYNRLEYERIYPFEFTSSFTPESERRQVNSPAGYWHPWKAMWDITFPNRHSLEIIEIEHSQQRSLVMDNETFHQVYYENYGFDVLLFWLPLSVLPASQAKVISVSEDEIQISYEGVEIPAEHGLVRLEAVLDVKNNLLAKETVAFCSERMKYRILYGRTDSFQSFDGFVLPKDYQICGWVQSTTEAKEMTEKALRERKIVMGPQTRQPEPDEFASLEPDTITGIQSLRGKSVDHRKMEMKFVLQESKLDNLDINENTFWPEVPEGYRYQDDRNDNQARKWQKNLTPDEKNLVVGKGPYVYPRKVPGSD